MGGGGGDGRGAGLRADAGQAAVGLRGERGPVCRCGVCGFAVCGCGFGFGRCGEFGGARSGALAAQGRIGGKDLRLVSRGRRVGRYGGGARSAGRVGGTTGGLPAVSFTPSGVMMPSGVGTIRPSASNL
ncbi:hypothetical protein HYN69_12430 [Gemmobacter aquarius]|uniref:Uncharacterized protein n=1 Tax=Paragemmobacter aquarius TaxID=2169400 RepID=A0A2S0UN30_9RHOB|nr:hypothetical protein [Gemmobacter aquarius]AWB49201.1 hypothetical protein HYN69_12430 [Gemmobacter aquarius]